ncbi:DMT family transporter [Metabacillus iocasae]|uniref:Transporter family-2 protein n=1 Tax=Priestia iocasae TaxID=2291674 RepID=A0ABS2QTT2_9BACI|nr:DMT family transporter [Metabacillus iocasae]MBM7702885.1 transporter family-2 protein [Metabacillus iocasae]
MKVVLYVLAVLAGVALSMEGAIAGVLGHTIGKLEASYYIFIMGTFVMGIAMLFVGQGNKLSYVFQAPKWRLSGGFLGIIYLTILVISIPFLGVSASMISVIIGQMMASMLIEHFGWLGSSKVKVDKYRILALASMAVALILIF